ncbi:MAG: LysR substrate-binding domain-containing protein [Holophaga sp.]|nr:LysR substrate-binding domain-containing protein [Holophaga sp.]
MELRLLRYFVAVAEELNVTRAAEKLHTAQPSLSQQIRQLEGVIGAPLFIRDKHRLKLTETGKVFLPAAKSILAAVESALFQARATARNEVGTIVLGMIPGPESMVFSHILPLLLRRSPETQLLLRTMTAPEAIQALLNREIMAAFLRGPIESDEISSEIYMHEEVVAMLPEHWELAKLARVPVKELARMPVISISAAIAPAVHQATQDIERRSGVTLTQGIGSESLMTSMNAVASGLGYCFFSEYVSEIVPKGVVTRPIDLDPAPTLDLLFAYRKDEPFAALATLISLVHEHSPYHQAQTARAR